jgi:hypothetical protein
MRDKLAKAATEADYRVYEKEQEVRQGGGQAAGVVNRCWPCYPMGEPLEVNV